ncbi:MAG TPA: hypothetical protein VGH33_24575, partial [Isosphaeraceae bacterium]
MAARTWPCHPGSGNRTGFLQSNVVTISRGLEETLDLGVRWLIGLVLILTASLGSCGCTGSGGAPSASSSITQARVKGRVTLKGKPLARAEIRFNPANIHRRTAPTATATTGDDGAYEVTTLVGENTVTLGGRALGKKAQSQYTAKTLDVVEGENTFDLPLP